MHTYIYGTILIATILKIGLLRIQNYYLIIIGYNTETIWNRNQSLENPGRVAIGHLCENSKVSTLPKKPPQSKVECGCHKEIFKVVLIS